MTDHLLRGKAPLADEAWAEIDEEADRTLRLHLAARKVVDFVGPLGWEAPAVTLGRVGDPVAGPAGDTSQARLRRVLALLELRTAFRVDRDEMEAATRGAMDPDTDPVKEAAIAAALAENSLVFNGYEPAGIAGIIPSSPHEAVALGDDYSEFPGAVAKAVQVLMDEGVDGPYALALGPRCWRGVVESVEQGSRVLDHVRRIVTDGPLVYAPGVSGSVVMSMRGGDYELVVGQDFSIGYLHHDASSVDLYLEQSLTFRTATPEAAVHLRYED